MVEVFQESRWTYFLAGSPEEDRFLSEYYSFFSPKARYDKRYKLYLWLKQKARKGKPVKGGWDGMIRLFKEGRISSGLFRATKKDLESKIKLKIRRDLPSVEIGEATAVNAGKYKFQSQCVDAMCRATRRGGGIILSATGCLAWDTYIDVPRNLNEHPHGIKIKDLVGTKPWVYCYDEKHKRMTLAQASSVHQSGRQVPVYRVHFEPVGFSGPEGRQRLLEPLDYLDATEDHLILMRDMRRDGNIRYTETSGTYVPVGELKPGDRVMPFFRKFGEEQGYAVINRNNGRHVPEHRFILQKTQGRPEPGMEGHHKDLDGLNNSPENLEWLTKLEHDALHGKLRPPTYDVHPRGMLGKKQSAKHAACFAQVSATRSEQLNAKGLTKRNMHRDYGRRGMSIKAIARKYHVSTPTIDRRLERFGLREANNHVVKSVEFLGYRDVYDMTVPGYNNFVANGVVVHNSGKTKMAGEYFGRMKNYSGLFIVDTINLMHQSAEEMGKWLGETVGTVGEGKYSLERVTVATRQTLGLHGKDRKFQKWFRNVNIVLIDELHEQMGKGIYKTLAAVDPIACFGLTATLQLGQKPVRMNAWSLCGPVIFEFPIAEATDRKVVEKGGVLQLLFPGRWREREKDYQREFRTEILRNGDKTQACAKVCEFLLKKGRYVMVLADRIKHVDKLSRKLPQPNYCIRGAVATEVRDRAKKGFEKGLGRLLIASRVFKKGTNIKRVDAIVDMAEGASVNDALQKFGRGVRLHADKNYLYYIDIGTQKGRFSLRAAQRANAFKKAGIPFRSVEVGSYKEARKAVREFMRSN